MANGPVEEAGGLSNVCGGDRREEHWRETTASRTAKQAPWYQLGACVADRRHTLASTYRVVTADGIEAAEKLLNSLEPGTELVQSQIETVREQQSGEQENTLLEVPITRFLFILRTV